MNTTTTTKTKTKTDIDDQTDLHPDDTFDDVIPAERPGPGVLTSRPAQAPTWARGRGAAPSKKRDLRTLFIVCSFGLALVLLIALNMK